MKLKTSDRLRIYEYVQGIIQGAELPTGNPHDGLVDDWFTWGHAYDINICLDDDGEYQCAVYKANDHFDWHSINLGEDFHNHVEQ